MPTKSIRRSIVLPYFPGFYESLLSHAIDQEEESFCEHEAEESDHETAEMSQPEHLRLNSSELASILFDVTNYTKAYHGIAHCWTDAFDTYASDAVGFPLKIAFGDVDSPREYNFTTDRVFATLTAGAVRKLYAASKADKHATLAKVIRERFTSYDGFHSHYSNTLSDWTGKPLANWDHNELETLLMAVLAINGYHGRETPSGDSVQMDIYYILSDGGFYQEWERGVDWAKFEEKRADARDDKAIEWAEAHPDEPAPEVPYRCRFTPDLFHWADARA